MWHTHLMEYYSALKRKEIQTHGYHMGGSWGHYVKWNTPVTKGQVLWFHSEEVLKAVKFIETESRMVVARTWRRGNGELFNGYSFSFIRWKEFWSWVGWWVNNNVNVFNATELYFFSCFQCSFYFFLLCWVVVHCDIYKGLTMNQIYHTWIHPLHHSPLSSSSPHS
jgi:hypothetical protein